MKCNLRYRRIEQSPGAVGGGGAGNLHRHPKGEENGTDSSVVQPWNVDATFAIAAA